jgi:hypothetical protein
MARVAKTIISKTMEARKTGLVVIVSVVDLRRGQRRPANFHLGNTYRKSLVFMPPFMPLRDIC